MKAGLHKAYFDNVYGHLCDHSHSNYISAMQIGQAPSLNTKSNLVKLEFRLASTYLLTLSIYASTFPPTADLIAVSLAKFIAVTWYFKSEDIRHIYD